MERRLRRGTAHLLGYGLWTDVREAARLLRTVRFRLLMLPATGHSAVGDIAASRALLGTHVSRRKPAGTWRSCRQRVWQSQDDAL